MGRNSAWLLFALALGLLVLPIWWVFAAVLAALWHEACHYFALRLCGGRAVSFRVGVTGVMLEVRGLGLVQELLCALAGPLGSILLLLTARWLPRTAICAGFQGIYNLLPIYPLDGGRAVRCLTELVFPSRWSHMICLWLERICLFGIIFLSLYGSIALHLGLAPVIAGMAIIWRVKRPSRNKSKKVFK